MHLIVYKPIKVDKRAFVKFWSACYTADDKVYEANIGQKLTEKRVLRLFTWKNQRRLSTRKRRSVLKNFLAKRSELDQEQTTEELLARFKKGSIWRIFWLHCWQPKRFPIYDQHVHRAMRFIEAGVIEEIPKRVPDKIRAYVGQYIPFHAQFNGLPPRDVDKALWAFGRFIKNNVVPYDRLR